MTWVWLLKPPAEGPHTAEHRWHHRRCVQFGDMKASSQQYPASLKKRQFILS